MPRDDSRSPARTGSGRSSSTPATPARDGALTFYRALREAGRLRITRLRPLPHGDLAAALATLAAEAFDDNLPHQCADQPPVDCTRGCAACCSLRVTASAPELLLLARWLRATAAAQARAGLDLQARLRSADARTRGLDERARVALRQRCPFVVDGACAVYPVRPLACRGHASHDRRACFDAAAGRRDDLPSSAPHRLLRSLVQSALLAELDVAGLAWGLSELNEGLVRLLDAAAAGQDNDARWRAGLNPLAGGTENRDDGGIPEAAGEADVIAEEVDWRAVLRELDALQPA